MISDAISVTESVRLRQTLVSVTATLPMLRGMHVLHCIDYRRIQRVSQLSLTTYVGGREGTVPGQEGQSPRDAVELSEAPLCAEA